MNVGAERKEVIRLEDLITELQDLRYLDWTDKKMSPGTPGCF